MKPFLGCITDCQNVSDASFVVIACKLYLYVDVKLTTLNEACIVSCSIGNRFPVICFIDAADFEPESTDEFEIHDTYNLEEVRFFYCCLAWIMPLSS